MQLDPILRGFAVLLLATTLATASPAANVHSLASAVDNHYNHLRSLECEFTETYSGLGMEPQRIGHALAEKTGKDAVAIPFS